MAVVEFLAQLAKLDIRLWVEDGRLRYSAPDGAFSAEIRAQIVAQKQDLIEFLQDAQGTHSEALMDAIPSLARESVLMSEPSDSRQTENISLAGGTFESSFAQQRMWLMDSLDPHSAAYSIPLTLRLKGQLNLKLVEFALSHIISRHETLRTTFKREGDHVMQVVHPHQELTVSLCELTHDTETTTLPASLFTLLEKEIAKPFDLATGPLLRAHIIRLNENDHVLMANVHHIIADGWSLGILTQELALLYGWLSSQLPRVTSESPYNDLSTDDTLNELVKDCPLPELPIQYADFSAWQRDWLQGDVLQAQLDYWREQLADVPVLSMPTDHVRPATPSGSGAHFHFDIESLPLKHFCEQHDVTAFMVLMCAWKSLLARYSGQSDICVGTPHANRSRVELEPLIGCFVNVLAIRSDIDTQLGFDELLRREREVTLAAYAHQDVPFDRLVNELPLARDTSVSPVFQVMFILQNAAQMARTSGTSTSGVGQTGTGTGNTGATSNAGSGMGLSIEPIELPGQTAKFDLTLSMGETVDNDTGMTLLKAGLEYNTDLFEQQSIRQLVDHFERLLRACLQMPTTPVIRHRLLSDSEWRQQVIDWNKTAQRFPKTDSFLQKVEYHSERHPEKIAVRFGAQTLNYRDLRAQYECLALHLVQQGVNPGDIVGVCLERSLDTIVALLGVLRAGAAYLPLDPYYPHDRIRAMVEDSGSAIMVAHSQFQTIFGSACRYIDPSEARLREHQPNQQLPSQSTFATQLAYVIYTSGSTGKPKGVMVEHQQLTNFLYAMEQAPGLDESDHLLAVTSTSFDIHTLELFLPLFVGGSLEIASKAMSGDADALIAALNTGEFTAMQATPSTWLMLLSAQWCANSDVGRPFKVMCGGEALSEDLKQQLLANQAIELWNMYGPTETTVWSAVSRIEDRHQPVRIGHPIANTDFYILDESLQIAPLGVAGELYIGGQGVTRGYLHRETLTAERFIKSPFAEYSQNTRGADVQGDANKIYRTGDLMRFKRTGELEYLGRTDFQVKIRGFRIELGEIENRLVTMADIDNVVVIAKQCEINEGDSRLIAYLTLKKVEANEDEYSQSDQARLQRCKEALTKVIPEFMVPSAWVVLEEMPLTPNGKIDRKALPDVNQDVMPSASHDYVAPRTAVEKKIAEIWRQLLKRDQVGVHDDFFALGGHSLTATQAIAQLRSVFQVELPLRDIFQRPTVEGIASAIETAMTLAGVGGQAQPRIMATDRTKAIPLSFSQQRLWFLHQMSPLSSAYHMPVALRVTGSAQFDVTVFESAFYALIERHDSLRTQFKSLDSNDEFSVQQVVRPHASGREFQYASAMLDTLTRSEAEKRIKELAIEHATLAFDLEADALIRCAVYPLAPQEHLVLLNMHHIVSDQWSVGVLIHDLLQYYLAIMNRDDLQTMDMAVAKALPPLDLQYVDYAVWQRDWLQGEVLQQQLDYWRCQLSGVKPLNLPSRTGVLNHSPKEAFAPNPQLGEQILFTVPQALYRQLERVSRQVGTTLFMTLLSGFYLLLERLSSTSDLCVGTPIANRQQAGLESLIGFFVNTLALRLDTANAMTFGELLAETKQMTLDAYAHQDAPFERVIDELNVSRDTEHSPIFQVLFALQNAPMEDSFELENSGLSIQALKAEQITARFDLSVNFSESHQELVGEVVYRQVRFAREQVQSWVDQLIEILDRVSHQIEEPLLNLGFNRGERSDYPERSIDTVPEPGSQRLLDKVDRVDSVNKAGATEDKVLPRNDVERVLAKHWVSLLFPTSSVDLGIDDHFFHLGGHSLLATRLNSKIRTAFNVELLLLELFQNPTIEGMANAIEQARLQGRIAAPPLRRLPNAEDIPLSYVQQRLWFVQRVAPLSAAYNLNFALKLDGHLNINALKAAFMQLVHRHAILRTVYIEQDGVPCARVIEEGQFPDVLTVWDADNTDVGVVDHTQYLNKAIQAQRATPFDLSVAPLLRAELHVLPCDEGLKPGYALLVSMHHIIGDAWTSQLLIRELALLYRSNAAGEPSPLPAVAYQYQDYAAWQLDYLSGDELDKQKNYWVKQLADAPDILHLPSDRPRPSVRTYAGAHIPVCLDAEKTKAMQAFCQRHNVTPFMFMLTAFQTLLSRYSGQTDICVGIPVAGRQRSEFESMVGCFVNALVIRSRIEKSTSVKQLISQVRQTTLDAYEHQHMPIHMVLEELKLKRSADVEPGAQVAFSLQNIPEIDSSITIDADDAENALCLEVLEHEQALSKYDLTMMLSEKRIDSESLEEVSGVLEYSTELFDASTIERFVQHYYRLIDQMLLDESQRAAFIPLMDEHQLQRHLGLDSERYGLPIRLSPHQHAIYLDSLVRPEGQHCGIGGLVCFPGDLDLGRWQQASRQLMQLEPCLRLRIVETDVPYLDVAYQVEDRSLEPTFEFLRFDDFKREVGDVTCSLRDHARNALHEFVYEPYRLPKSPLWSLKVIELNGEFMVALRAHHLLVDGVGVDILFKGLVQAYEALSPRSEEAQTEKTRAEKIAKTIIAETIKDEQWLESYIAEAWRRYDTEPTLDFWRKTLDDVTPVQAVFKPLHDRSRRATRVTRATNEDTLLPEDVRIPRLHKSELLNQDQFKRLKQFSRQQGVTTAHTLKAVYSILLKYCFRAEDPFFILDYAAGREGGYQDALGCFYRQTPIVLAPDLFEDSFESLLRSFVKKQKQSKAYQAFSLVEQAKLLPESRLVLIFNYQAFGAHIEFEGRCLDGEGLVPYLNNAIQFMPREVNKGLRLDLYYPQNLMLPSQFLQRLLLLLEQVLVSPQAPLNQLSFLLAGERARLLERSKGPVVALRHDEQQARNSLANAVNVSAQQNPEKPAIAWAKYTVSYASLMTIVARLSETLNESLSRRQMPYEKGKLKQATVAVLMHRSPAWVASMVASVDSGAQYLPLDPAFPDARIVKILQSAEPVCIVLDDEQYQRLLASERFDEYDIERIERHVLHTDAGQEGVCKSQALNVVEFVFKSNVVRDERTQPVDLRERQRIYSIYTSGSTGEPKGTAAYLDSFQNLLDWYQQDLKLCAEDRVLIFSGVAFDLTQKNVWASLRCGATIVMLDSPHYDPESLRALIHALGVTWINCAPSAFYPLLGGAHDQQSLLSLKTVVLGGEAIDLSKLNASSLPEGVRCFNSYGPSECTDVVAYSQIHLNDDKSHVAREVSLGAPIRNSQVLLLDANGRLVPDGVPGEIVIAGLCVGPGYDNDAEKTQQCFYTHEALFEGSAYRSGDLAYYEVSNVRGAPSGHQDRHQWVYVGRKDQQIKLNGYRIELGEIEAILQEQQAVQTAIVVPHQRQSLVAYVQLQSETQVLKSILVSWCEQRLPAYMVPSTFVFVDALPLNASGKIDRRQLAQRDLPIDERQIVQPKGETERKLAEIWNDVLGRSQISADASFFDVGGNSLLAVRMMSRVQREFKIDLPLVQLFHAQSLQQLGALVDNKRDNTKKAASGTPIDSADSRCLIPLTRSMVSKVSNAPRPKLFLVHPVGGSVLCYRSVAGALQDRVEVYGLQARGIDRGSQPFNDFEEMVNVYVACIRQVQPRGPYHLAGQSVGGLIALAIAQRLSESSELSAPSAVDDSTSDVSVASLQLIDTYVPDRKRAEKTTLSHMLSNYGTALALDEQALNAMPDNEALASVYDALLSRSLLPSDMAFEDIQRLYGVIDDISQRTALYQLQPYDGQVVHYEAERDSQSRQQWSQWLRQAAFETVPGNHDGVLESPNAEILASRLYEVIRDNA